MTPQCKFTSIELRILFMFIYVGGAGANAEVGVLYLYVDTTYFIHILTIHM